MDFQDYKHTHIPAFGNWDYEHGSPFTQYFESARQAGLLRYNYGEADLYSYGQHDYYQHKDLYMQPTHTVPARRKSKTKEAREKIHDHCQTPHLKDQMKKQKKVYDVEQTARQHQERLARRNDGRVSSKAVDEDLYKIPPELYPRKKKLLGFFSSCLVPSCAA